MSFLIESNGTGQNFLYGGTPCAQQSNSCCPAKKFPGENAKSQGKPDVKIIQELDEKFKAQRASKMAKQSRDCTPQHKSNTMFNGMQPQQPQQQQQQQQGNGGFLFGGPDLNTIARAKQQAFQNSGNAQMMNMFNPSGGSGGGGGDPSCPSGMCGSVMSGPNTTTYNLMPPGANLCGGNSMNNKPNGMNNPMGFSSNLNSIPVPEHPSSAFPSFDCIMNQTQQSNPPSHMHNGFGGPAAFGGNMPNFINLNTNLSCFKCGSSGGGQGQNWGQMSQQSFFPSMCGNQMQNNQGGMIQQQQQGHQNDGNGMVQMRTLF